MFLFLLTAISSVAANLKFERGVLSLDFDENTGSLRSIACRGEVLALPREGVPSVTFATGPTNNVVWFEQMRLPRKLVRHQQPAADTLELTVTAGNFELTEIYRLHKDRPRLDRSLRLTNKSGETVKLRGVAFRTEGIKSTPNGFYRFPGVWPCQEHPFAAMQPGRSGSGRGSIAPALAQLSPRQSLMWASYADDPPTVQITEDTGRFEVRQSLSAAGYLRPNEPQTMGFVTMEVLEGDYWQALARMWDWMASVGLKVPADRPKWVPEAILYSFQPGGTIGSGFKDLGGFQAATQKLLPTLPRLGINSIWIMPVEYRSPYWPLDYYRFMEGLGDAAQFKQLIAKAHEQKLHVLQDLVPHGGAPLAVHNKENPEFMVRLEDGSTLNYWLNDFARPDWQRFVARVATHYVSKYNVDGYRVDACSGSKEMNWSPDIPYARASLSKMNGGLGMLRGIRREVKQLKPRDGALLAEVESARHLAVSDAMYDFNFCYHLCRQWNHMEAGAFVEAVQTYLEEQKLAEPRGAVRLRHIESHDSLRAQGWYGVRGLRAMYALSAWIDGMPMIYHGMEDGHGFALAEINRIRRERPELSRGEAFYRAVNCDTPGVFTCLRKLGNRMSVVAINFNREPVRANLKWRGGKATVSLAPLDYVVLPERNDVATKPDKTVSAGDAKISFVTLGDVVSVPGATEWFVDTIEGRLHDAFVGVRYNGQSTRSSIYWRPQGSGNVWQHCMVPLDLARPQLGFKVADGRWHVYRFGDEFREDLRLTEQATLLGAAGLRAKVIEMTAMPPAPDVSAGVCFAGVKLRCVGPDYIVSNNHFTVTLRRQGGVIREFRVGTDVLAREQDFYGDQEYFSTKEEKRMEASSDVECGARLWTAPDGLHLRFEGQLRGDYRFALKRPPLWFRNEYVFSSNARFTQRWAFRTEKTIKDQRAFLSNWFTVDAERFRFERDGKPVTEDAIAQEMKRRGQTKGLATPDTILFVRNGKPSWSLTDVKASGTSNFFMQASRLFVTALEGTSSVLDADRWYEFGVTWNTPATRKP